MGFEVKMFMDGKETSVAMKEDVAFSDILAGINRGVAMCYEDSGKHIPELLEFAIPYAQLSTLTDLDLGDTADDAYRIIKSVDSIPGRDALFIEKGIRSAIEHRTAMTAATICGAGASELAASFGILAENLNGILKSANQVLEALLSEAQENKDIDPKDIMNVLQSLKVSNSDLVHSMLDYSKARGPLAEKPIKSAKKGFHK